MKEGYGVDSTDIRNILMSSKYTFLKEYTTSTGSSTISAGNKTCYVDFSHSLGYIPFFLAYVSVSSLEDGKERMIPAYSWGSVISGGYSIAAFSNAYANSSIIRCSYELTNPYNKFSYNADQIYHELDSGSVNILAGNASGNGYSSAVRFPNVVVNQSETVVSAQINWTDQVSGPTNLDTKMKVFGLDYDNCPDVTTSLTRTDAYISQSQSKVSGTFGFNSNVKSQLEEIIARSGWSSGNRMGFSIDNDGSPTDAYVGGTNSSFATLDIIRSGTITVNFRVLIFKDKIL